MIPKHLKDLLKRSALARSTNARIRAVKLRRQLGALRANYVRRAREMGVNYSPESAIADARESLSARGIHPRGTQQASLRIFWAGTAREQDNSGFLPALKQCAQVITMVDATGEYGFRSVSPRDSALPRDALLVAENDRLLLEQVRRAHAERPFDVLMGQMWANFISVDALREVQTMGIATINVAMDDRLPEHWGTYRGTRLGSIGLARGLDLVLTTTKECCLWYGTEGCPALYWPLASSPSIFRESATGVRDIDVAFIGSRYGIRAKVVGALENAGIRVNAYGTGWPLGSVPFDACAEIFGRAKIVLGIGTVGYTDDIYTIKLRDFDGPMSGALYLTHRNPDLLELFLEDQEIACYRTITECVAQTERFLADDDLRLRISAAGAARARREHTWEARIAYPLRALGFID